MKMMAAKMLFGKVTICDCDSCPNDVVTNVMVCKGKWFGKLAATCAAAAAAAVAVTCDAVSTSDAAAAAAAAANKKISRRSSIK